VLVGDFNQDGKLDLVVHGPFVLSTFLGNGDGTFVRYKDYKYQYLFGDTLAGDFNGDGKLDLLVFGGNLCQGICFDLLVGNGDGTFKALRKIYSDSNMKACGFQNYYQVSDFNGDGKLDIAFCNQTGQIGVLLGNGDGTFQAPFFTAALPGMIVSFGIGDFNADGKPDLIASEFYSISQNLTVTYLGNGDGTFQSPQSQSAPNNAWGEAGLAVGDFNRDGLLDAIYQYGLGMEVLIQQ
jgi:hypothetical protein